MTFRPAPRIHEPAIRMNPLVDPAGWTAADLAANDDWVYVLSDDEKAEILSAVEMAEKIGLDILDINRANFPLPIFDEGLAVLKDELLHGRGFFMLRGLPVADMTQEQAGMAFWAMGARFGRFLSQNPKGHKLGHVKDFGGDYHAANVRGYQTAAQMNFHSDQCDSVWLMCMHPAKSGGESLIASTVTIYNTMLERRPELAEALIGDFYNTKHGEVGPGEDPYYKLPIFSFHDGYFSARGASVHALKAFDLPGVPPATESQLEAFGYFQELARELAFGMDFRHGDIQVLHNHVAVHTRTAFEDWPEVERKRHLMRLWMVDENGRPLVQGFRENLTGIEVPGMKYSAPVNVFEPA